MGEHERELMRLFYERYGYVPNVYLDSSDAMTGAWGRAGFNRGGALIDYILKRPYELPLQQTPYGGQSLLDISEAPGGGIRISGRFGNNQETAENSVALAHEIGHVLDRNLYNDRDNNWKTFYPMARWDTQRGGDGVENPNPEEEIAADYAGYSLMNILLNNAKTAPRPSRLTMDDLDSLGWGYFFDSVVDSTAKALSSKPKMVRYPTVHDHGPSPSYRKEY